MAGTALVFGARNLGAHICEHFAGLGWNVGAVSRSAETAAALSARLPQALTLSVDASQPDQFDSAVDSARDCFGSLDLLVNAASPGGRSRGPFGGGPLVEAELEDFDRYATQVARQVFVFVSRGARALRGHGGTLVQITGGSSRRAIAGRGSWAAGAFATRALTQAASLELREERIHAALLIVDATIARAQTTRGPEPASDALTTNADVAAAVEYLASQPPHGWTHELQITPSGDRWVP